MPRIHCTLVLLVLLAVVSAFTPRAGAEASPVKIYVFSGQSNMGVSAGRKYVRDNHPEIGKWVDSEDNDVLLFHRRVTDTQHGKPGEKLGNRRVWGYEVMVGYHLWHYWQRKNPAQEFVIVKVAKGATGISFWSPDRAAKGYKALAASVGDAIKHVTDQGKPYEGGAFFWYQGEHDTTPVISSHGAREYPAQLDSLVEATRATSASGEPGIRALLQSPRMPFVLARIHYYPNRAGFNIEHYRREVAKWVQADDHQPAAMINTDDLTMRDGLHLSDLAIVRASRRFFDAYLRLIEPADHPHPPRLRPTRRDFVDSIEASLVTRTRPATIHYTTDGSEPTPESPRYTQAWTLREPTSVKAITVESDGDRSIVSVIPLRKITGLWPALARPDELPEGFRYTRYEYKADSIPESFPDLGNLKVLKQGRVNEVEAAVDHERQGVALRVEGYLAFPHDDVYHFRAWIDYTQGACRMLVDGKVVIGPAGEGLRPHGATGTTRRWLPLRAGLHKVVLEQLKPEGVKTGRLRPIVKGRTWEGGWFRELLPVRDDRSDP